MQESLTATPLYSPSRRSRSATRGVPWPLLALLRVACLLALPLAAFALRHSAPGPLLLVLLATGALLLAAVTCRLAVAETLLLLPHVGCQLESMSLWCVRSCVCVCASPVVFLLRRLPPRILSPTSILCRGTTSRRLIPIDTLAAVVINEAVTTTGVYFYLAIAQAGSLHLHLPFPQLRPRLAELVGPYRAARAMVPEHMPPWPSAAPPLSQSPGGALDGTLRLFTG